MSIQTAMGFLMLSLSLAACGFPKTASVPPPLPAVAGSESLATGRDTFIAECNGCHGYPDLASIPDAKWPDVMQRMGPKSELSAKQSDDVLHFIVAARDAMKGQ